MGMFDEIAYETVCPVCKNKLDGFQSKSGDCVLDILSPTEVDNFYTFCRVCGCWVEYNDQKNGKYLRTVQGKNDKPMPEHEKEVDVTLKD